MFWKTKQRSMTPLEESVLAKMNLFLKSRVIIFINRKEERKNFTWNVRKIQVFRLVYEWRKKS